MMGDFNAGPESPAHRLLTTPETGLRDTWQLLGRPEDADSFTHHGFQGVPRDNRIDWILVTPHFRAMDVRIIRDQCRGRYPSDHFPYTAILEWDAR
jgi:endonuclease/exonuclease/phosphatase family metal-dependent hydrolase